MKIFNKFLSIFIIISLPYVLIMFTIRILFTPSFLAFEYNLPGFPEDVYGFSTEERLQWGTYSIEYLFNNEDPQFLENLRFENGTSIYNEREISHMVDVKVLLQQTMTYFYILLGINLLIIIWLFLKNQKKLLWDSLSKGGWFTIGLIAFILMAVAISFNALFTAFHRIFFEGDTWLFNYSDTLIRLFPIRLWQDAFIFMGIITVGLAFFFAIFGKKRSSKLQDM